MSPNQKTDSGYAPVNGIKMYYKVHYPVEQERHPGIPIILIHGGGSTIQTSFSKILPMLAAHYEIIAVELQGHGHTSDRHAAESFEQDANDVAALLSYLKISKANILGFSNGGHTAMQIGISYPGIVNKLILISCFYRRDGAIAGFFDRMPSATLDNMPGPLKTAYLQAHNYPTGLQTMFAKDKERMVHFKDWPDEQLQAITSSTLIIVGDQDVVTPEHAVKMTKIIPHARLMVLPGTHGSFIGEVCTAIEGSKIPEATVSIIAEFLDK